MSAPDPLHAYPGAALRVSPDGLVRRSNGRLDALVGRALVGTPLAEALDSSSQAKWRRILTEDADPTCLWEMVVMAPTALEVRTFLAVPAAPDAGVWLLEHGADAASLIPYQEMSELNLELIEAQRALGRERRRLQLALEEAQGAVRTRDDVLAIVSHDLRNPLNTITMAAGLLALPISDEKKAFQIAVIQRSAESANKLIGDLLDVSAIESGKLTMELETLPVGAVIAEPCRMAEGMAQKRGQRFECTVAEAIPRLRGDRYRLEQVLANLLGNAIKFTPTGGMVRLVVEERAGEVVTSVSDTGPGISSADLPRIFDRFWHAGRRRHGGAGLGLAIAKGIVDAHGGRIWVESTPGTGSTFHFALPAGGEPDAPSPG